jgi:hypothetical protein
VTDGGLAGITPRWIYTSTAAADATARAIIRGAGALTLGSALLALALPPKSTPTGAEAIWIPVVVAGLVGLGLTLIFLGPRWLRTTAKVSDAAVLLSASGVRTRLPLEEIESVSNSYFPSGGYGYRYLGKGHRGFISGGPQIDLKLKDGREFTVSVRSVPDFCTAVEEAKNQL